MSTISHGWKNHTARWWTLTFPRLPKSVGSILEDLSDVPGVSSVVVRRTNADGFHDVVITMHESAFAAEPYLHLRDVFELHTPRASQPPLPLVPTFRTLRDYQREGAEWLVERHGGVLGDEMGLGKTTTAITAAHTMRRSWDPNAPVLIVGPKFTRDVWRRELREVLGPTQFFACEGRKPTNEQEVELAAADWVFVHYEILDGWRAALTRPMFARRPVVMIFDEAHWLKNPRSKRGKSALAIGPLAPARIVLSGTPIANRVLDLWPLLTIAGGGGSFGTPFAFAHRYTHHEKGSYGWTSIGTRRMPELQGRMEGLYLRRTLDDVGTELPAMTREQLTLSADGAKMPAALRKWTGSNLVLALDRLRDAFESGNLGGDTLQALVEWRKWTSEVKMPSTVHLAASLLDEDEHVVVFCWQRETAEQIAASIKDCMKDEVRPVDVHVIHGGIEQTVRDAMVQSFQTGDRPAAIVATIDSLKEGVTLHRARRVIMHDLHWVPATMLQAEARIHRLGQKRPTLSTWMIVEGSVDSVIARHLTSKAETISEALSDTRAEDAFDEVGIKPKDHSGAEFARRILEGT